MMARWRIPDCTDGRFGFDANLTEVGIGNNNMMLRRFMFDEVVSVRADQWIEVDADGGHYLCDDKGRTPLKGKWIKTDDMLQS